MNSFEGSFLGQADRIDGDTILECGVCWSVYDPALGDPVWQIPPGTAFSDLPDHWRCPHCDAAQEQFMVLEAGGNKSDQDYGSRSTRADASLHGRLAKAIDEAAGRMQSLPVYRDDLPRGVFGPQHCDAGQVALVYAPWSMHVVLMADDSERLVEGSERDVAFPSGSYPFVRGYLDGVGAVENCSLFSPMNEFEDGAAVIAVARAAFEELLRSPEGVDEAAEAGANPADVPDNPSRRSLLTAGGLRG